MSQHSKTIRLNISTCTFLIDKSLVEFNVMPHHHLCSNKWKHEDRKKTEIQLTSSAAMVKQGQCFFVSLILTVLAFWAVLRALERLSGANSRQISLASADTPSSWNSSKNLACRKEWQEGGVRVNTSKSCQSICQRHHLRVHRCNTLSV